MNIKSPFVVKQEFLSPLQCEDMVDFIGFTTPDLNREEKPTKTTRTHDFSQELIFSKLEGIIPGLEEHFGIKYSGTEEMSFEWFPQGCDGEKPHCDSCEFLRSKWVKTRNRDLTGIIFLSDYQDSSPFDNEFEVYGGKLEFVQHQFGFNPQRGTLIVFPSDPHFINNTAPVLAGDLYQVRFHIAAKSPIIYDPTDYPGDYRTWFEEIA